MPIREPAVSRKTLVTTAAIVWAAVGLFLIVRAGMYAFELFRDHSSMLMIVIIAGLLLGLAKGHFAFARLAQSNVDRINQLSPHKKKICVFAFQAWQSYLVVLVMIALGIALRISPLPRIYLIGIYLLIGVGLLFGSRAYLTR